MYGIYQMASRRSFLQPSAIASILEEDDDDLVEPEPSDESEDEEAEGTETVELVFDGQGNCLHEIRTRQLIQLPIISWHIVPLTSYA
jgi:hypothetical protein